MEHILVSAELKSHFLNLYQIALSDGNFSSMEMKMLYEFAEERGVSKNSLNQLLLNPKQHLTEIPESIEEKLSYLIDFCVMSWADGIVVEDEIITLKKFILSFGFLEENIDELAKYLLDAVENGLSKKEIIKKLNT